MMLGKDAIKNNKKVLLYFYFQSYCIRKGLKSQKAVDVSIKIKLQQPLEPAQ